MDIKYHYRVVANVYAFPYQKYAFPKKRGDKKFLKYKEAKQYYDEWVEIANTLDKNSFHHMDLKIVTEEGKIIKRMIFQMKDSIISRGESEND